MHHVHLCDYVCVSVCVHMNIGACSYLFAHKCIEAKNRCLLSSSITFKLILWGLLSLWNWYFFIFLECLLNELQESPCLCLLPTSQGWGYRYWSSQQVSTWVLEFWDEVLMLAQMSLSWYFLRDDSIKTVSWILISEIWSNHCLVTFWSPNKLRQ